MSGNNPIDIIYSDESIAVVNKPAGMLSVPGRGPERRDSAVCRVCETFPGCITQPSVHRLDMDTSGLLVFALTREAHRGLSFQFQNGKVHKKYTAVLDGLLDARLGSSGRIELCFRLNPANRPFQVYDPLHGKKGITFWRTAGIDGNQTRIEFEPQTGRTHQLRLHSAHPVRFEGGINKGGLGRPIAGDRLYGSSCDKEHATGVRMLLHASALEFNHPATGKRLIFENPVPF